MAAYTALAGRVSRVDVADGEPCAPGFVGGLRLKIAESPGVQDPSLLPVSSYPLADAFEILEGDPASGAFGCGDDLLADEVIHV